MIRAPRDEAPTLVRCTRAPTALALHVLVSKAEGAGERGDQGGGERSAAVVVIASDPAAPPIPAADALQHLFDLTPTLARLAAAIAAGKTVSEYADDHDVRESTARQQLKELMARVGVHRQAELVRVLLGGVAHLRRGGAA